MPSDNSMSRKLSEGKKMKGLNGSILDCQAVHGKFYKAISSPAIVGLKRSTVSSTKEAVLVFLLNFVIGGKQSTGSNASIKK